MAGENRDREDGSTSSEALSIRLQSPPDYRIQASDSIQYPNPGHYVFSPATSYLSPPHARAPSPLPAPRYPPTTKDWENHRSVLTQLYSVENRTLKEAMEIMKNQYNFRATRRMFNYRIADWNLQKNSKNSNHRNLLKLVKQYERQVLRHQSVHIPRPRKESSSLPLPSATQSSQIVHQDETTYPEPIFQALLADLRSRTSLYSSPRPTLLLPHQLLQAEIILKQTDIYYDSFVTLKIEQRDDDFSIGILPESMLVSPWDFCNTLDSAFELFNQGQQREAFVLLEDASRMTKPMLKGNHSETLQSLLFNAADWSSSAPTDVFRLLWRYIAEMAALVLGQGNPISLVCFAILRLESGHPSLVYENAFKLILGKLGVGLGSSHKQTLRAKDKYNTLVSLAGDMDTVERLQMELVWEYEGTAKYSEDGVWAVYGLGGIQQRRGNFGAAEETFRDALGRSRVLSGDDFPSQMDISIIHSLATAMLERNEYEECEGIMREALETCLRNEEKGAERDWRTPKILGDLTWILEKAGKDVEIEKLKEEYPEAFEGTQLADVT